jgi:hypothetical protein
MTFIKASNKVFTPKLMDNVSLASSVLAVVLAGKNIANAKKDYHVWYAMGLTALAVSAYMIYKGSTEGVT